MKRNLYTAVEGIYLINMYIMESQCMTYSPANLSNLIWDHRTFDRTDVAKAVALRSQSSVAQLPASNAIWQADGVISFMRAVGSIH